MSFFVISGVRITRLIVDEQRQTGRPGHARFYFRRMRRLLPAALATIIVCAIVVHPVLAPRQLANFLERIPFAVFSLANVFFCGQVGHFDATAQMKPLLHLWPLLVHLR